VHVLKSLGDYVLFERTGSTEVCVLCGSVQTNLQLFAHASYMTEPLTSQETKNLLFPRVNCQETANVCRGKTQFCSIEQGHERSLELCFLYKTVYVL
jgi:hypothetical protein